MASKVPSASPLAPTLSLKRKRGDTSNTLIHQLVNNPALLGSADLGEHLKKIHRINPVSARKKARHADGESATVFNDQSGHHEWIPTSMAEEVLKQGDLVWLKLWTALRSPTWLLILRPDTYCMDKASYNKVIASVIAKIEAARAAPTLAIAVPPIGSIKPPPAKKPKLATPVAVPAPLAVKVATRYAKASQLGLVGHSGGLNVGGTDQTTFQAIWHDELRDIYRKHAKSLAYDAYWAELVIYIRDHFLFYDDLSLPGVTGNSVTASEVMAHIEWDMSISGRGNPGVMSTMLDAAQYLRQEWSWWAQGLHNAFRVFRNF